MTQANSDWSEELRLLYESHAAGQFILHGNVEDRFLLKKGGVRLGSLDDFLLDVVLDQFEVVLGYDLGNGLRVLKGGSTFSKWPSFKQNET